MKQLASPCYPADIICIQWKFRFLRQQDMRQRQNSVILTFVIINADFVVELGLIISSIAIDMIDSFYFYRFVWYRSIFNFRRIACLAVFPDNKHTTFPASHS